MRKLLLLLFAPVFSYGQGQFPIGSPDDTIRFGNVKILNEGFYDVIPSILQDETIPAYKNIKDSTDWENVMLRGNRTTSSAHIVHGSEALGLHASEIADHVYMGFYPDSSDENQRYLYMGYPSNGAIDFEITSEILNGNIKLATNGGQVEINGGDAIYGAIPTVLTDETIPAYKNLQDSFILNQYRTPQTGTLWVTDTVRGGVIGAGQPGEFVAMTTDNFVGVFHNFVSGGFRWDDINEKVMELNDGLVTLSGGSAGYLQKERTLTGREWMTYADNGIYNLWNNFNGPIAQFGYVSGNANFLFNVGIGQASPTEKLDVNGNIKSTNISSFFRPVTSTDAAAPNNSIYYSSDQSKLVYKDSGGVVNALY